MGITTVISSFGIAMVPLSPTHPREAGPSEATQFVLACRVTQHWTLIHRFTTGTQNPRCKLCMENPYRIWLKFIRVWPSLFLYTETRKFKDFPSGISGWYLPCATWVSNVSVSTFPCRLSLWGWVQGSVLNKWKTQNAYVGMYTI